MTTNNTTDHKLYYLRESLTFTYISNSVYLSLPKRCNFTTMTIHGAADARPNDIHRLYGGVVFSFGCTTG